MLSQLVLGRAMMQVARIDLAGVAADRCARRGRHLRWLHWLQRIDIRAALGRDAGAGMIPAVAQPVPTRDRR